MIMAYIGCLIIAYIPLLENTFPRFFGNKLNTDHIKIIKSSVTVKRIKRLVHHSEISIFAKPIFLSVVIIKKVLKTVTNSPTGPTFRGLVQPKDLGLFLRSNNYFSFSKNCCSYTHHRRPVFNPQSKVSTHPH